MISKIIKLLLSIVAVSVAIFVVLGANSYTSLLPSDFRFWEQWTTKAPASQTVVEPVVEPQIVEADSLLLQEADSLLLHQELE